MTGTVYIAGGGSAQQEGAVWSAMLATEPRILYWPFALEPASVAGAESWLRRTLDGFGMGRQLTTWASLPGHDPAELAAVDLLFVGGGNTFRLLHQVRSAGFTQPVRDFVAAGGSYYGGSAGAILAGSSIATAERYDANEIGLTDVRGLDLVPGLVVLPHYESADLSAVQRWSRTRRLPVVAVPESSGLSVQGDDVRVLGPEPVDRITGTAVSRYQAGSRMSLAELVPPHGQPEPGSKRDT